MSEHEKDTVKKPSHLVDLSSDDDRRNHDRVEVNQDFRCIEDYISEFVSSISPGGVFIRSKKPLAVGTRVMLKFSIIVDDVETVEGEGEVVRVDNSPENMGMGVAFTRLSAESKKLLDELIERDRQSR
jgi:uncharacterized protein (TIGR02266 family)